METQHTLYLNRTVTCVLPRSVGVLIVSHAWLDALIIYAHIVAPFDSTL